MICLILIFTYVAGQMRGVGIVFSQFLNIPIFGVVVGWRLSLCTRYWAAWGALPTLRLRTLKRFLPTGACHFYFDVDHRYSDSANWFRAEVGGRIGLVSVAKAGQHTGGAWLCTLYQR